MNCWNAFDRTQAAPPPVPAQRFPAFLSSTFKSRHDGTALLFARFVDYLRLLQNSDKSDRKVSRAAIEWFTYNLHTWVRHVPAQQKMNGSLAQFSELWVERMHQTIKALIQGRANCKIEIFVVRALLRRDTVEMYCVNNPAEMSLHLPRLALASASIGPASSAAASVSLPNNHGAAPSEPSPRPVSILSAVVCGAGHLSRITELPNLVGKALGDHWSSLSRSHSQGSVPMPASVVLFHRAFVRGHQHNSLQYLRATQQGWQAVVRLNEDPQHPEKEDYCAIIAFLSGLQAPNSPLALVSVYKRVTLSAPLSEPAARSGTVKAASDTRNLSFWQQRRLDWTQRKHVHGDLGGPMREEVRAVLSEAFPMVETRAVYLSTGTSVKKQVDWRLVKSDVGVRVVPLSSLVAPCLIPLPMEHNAAERQVPVLWCNNVAPKKYVGPDDNK